MKYFFTVANISLLMSAIAASPLELTSPNPAKRQTNACGVWSPTTPERVGDGAPSYKTLNIQLSAPLSCASNHECAVGYGSYESVTIQAEVSGGKGWIDGGFSVSKTWETGNNYECGGVSGETICVMQEIPFTEYNAQGGVYNACTREFRGDKKIYRISSPNKSGQKFFCKNDGCVDKGTKTWV
ncbi:hypothetical protein BDV95DRAFT_608860 [Massariosphaeria phaeospora]|uniref:Ig-like domain-containing protein n=1 Tax=Massariosphaeria phaeospora TaxID=100035 RepID=A0A7C8M5K5_9PLEO|nr:hypothetical protein BDV95DRAFT_608860 [Massariosphaeria phaeospora]